MIEVPKPYPAYKDSGLLWLKVVPEHWNLIPNRALIRKRKILVGDQHTNYQLLSLTKEGVIVRDIESGKGKFSADMGTSQEVRAGDLIFCLFDVPETPRTVGLSHHNGMITGAYTVFECSDPVLSVFLELFYKAMDDRKLLGPIYSGLRNTIPPMRFLGIKTPVPPHDEQIAIVRFLDHMDRRIRRYIRAKQKLIKLLEEQKAAIIHRAVTRGLDPSVSLKPSGVEWLGDVPVHWDVMPLRRVTISRCDGPFGSGLKSSHYTDHGIRVVRLQNIGYAEFKNQDSAFISPSHYSSLGDHTVEPGDLLIAGLGDENHPPGRACVAPNYIVPAMVKADCFRFRLFQQRLYPEFAALQLTATASDASSILSTGATRQRTNLQATASRSIALPPIKEQIKIVQYITSQTSTLRLAINGNDNEIRLLREYSTRLISDVVTGNLDVRSIDLPAAGDAELPEEYGDLQDVDATIEDEEPQEILAEGD